MQAWNQGTSAGAIGVKSDNRSEECVENRIRALDKEVCEKQMKDKLGHASAIKDLRVDTNITRVAAQRVFLPVYILRYPQEI